MFLSLNSDVYPLVQGESFGYATILTAFSCEVSPVTQTAAYHLHFTCDFGHIPLHSWLWANPISLVALDKSYFADWLWSNPISLVAMVKSCFTCGFGPIPLHLWL